MTIVKDYAWYQDQEVLKGNQTRKEANDNIRLCRNNRNLHHFFLNASPKRLRKHNISVIN